MAMPAAAGQGSTVLHDDVTFEADEAVDAAEHERVVGAEQLEVLDGRRGAGAGGGGVRRRGDDGGDVVARVSRHDRARGQRPVRALRAALAGVLDHHRRHLRRLAVAHCSVSPATRTRRRRTKRRGVVGCYWWTERGRQRRRTE